MWRKFPNPRSDEFVASFGNRLIAAGLLDERTLQRAIRAATQNDQRLDAVLLQLGLVAEVELVRHLSTMLNIKSANAIEVVGNPILNEIVPESFVRTKRVLPLSANDNDLNVAVVDPFDKEALNALAYATGSELTVSIISATDFDKAIALRFAEAGSGSLTDNPRVANEADLQRLRELANEAPVIKTVNQIIGNAIEANASDIHIEPEYDGLHVRYRIDGALRAVETLSPALRSAIASRIKIMARLDIAERRMPQDGRTRVPVRGVDIDFRVSTLPTAHGESIVMRVLDRSRVPLDFDALGFNRRIVARLREVIRQPNGIVLVTGPTGSGKTTTLYTALKEISRPDVKVITVEDPIEYQLPGINQVQVHAGIGLDFPHTLRSILRQDPDVIMVGEIRDAETARIAIQAALTGHLVFSTLHTNGAASAFTRLLDMGVESFLIASTVRAVMAQRLVRRLCSQCATPMKDAERWLAMARAHPDVRDVAPLLQVAKGCPSCRQTGFSGRATVAELLVVDQEIARLVSSRAAEAEVQAAACSTGMLPLYLDGLEKCVRGITSIDEVMRIAELPADPISVT